MKVCTRHVAATNVNDPPTSHLSIHSVATLYRYAKQESDGQIENRGGDDLYLVRLS